MKKTLALNLVLGVATLLFAWAMGRNIYDKMGFVKKPAPRAEMRVLLKSLQLEDSAAQVQRRFNAAGFKTLKIDTRNSWLWSIDTPIEFGAKNWKLFLEFDDNTKLNANAKLAAIRLRTPDGTNIRPRDIDFPDRVRSDWISPDQESWNRS